MPPHPPDGSLGKRAPGLPRIRAPAVAAAGVPGVPDRAWWSDAVGGCDPAAGVGGGGVGAGFLLRWGDKWGVPSGPFILFIMF